MEKNIYEILDNCGYPYFFEGDVEDNIDNNRLSSYWYDGLIITINGPNSVDFQIETINDTEIYLYEKENLKNLIAYFKDSTKLIDYIEDDEELYLLFLEHHPKYYMVDKGIKLWSLRVIDEDLGVITKGWLLRYTSLDKALEETVDIINNFNYDKDHLKKLSILSMFF